MDEETSNRFEYEVRYANEVLGNLERFNANIQEEKDDMRRLLGWLKGSLEDLEPLLTDDNDILLIAKLRIRIMKLVKSF